MNRFSILESRTFYTVLLLGIYNTLAQYSVIHPSPLIDLSINFLGIVIATYFHVNPSQSYNPPVQQG